MAPPRQPRGRSGKPSASKRPRKAAGSTDDRRGRKRDDRDDRAGPKRWGSVARRGAGRLQDDRPAGASEAFRDAAGLHDGERDTETWVRVDDDLRSEAAGAIERGRRSPRRPPSRETRTPGAAEFEK